MLLSFRITSVIFVIAALAVQIGCAAVIKQDVVKLTNGKYLVRKEEVVDQHELLYGTPVPEPVPEPKKKKVRVKKRNGVCPTSSVASTSVVPPPVASPSTSGPEIVVPTTTDVVATSSTTSTTSIMTSFNFDDFITTTLTGTVV